QHKQVLLAIAPVEEGDLMVQPLCAFIKKISQISHPSELNLSFLIGNNCATNQAAATLQLQGGGGSGGRLWRRWKRWELMAALRTINIRAALREYTPLSPLRPNATRWSATFEMVAGYVRCCDEIKGFDAIFDHIPKAATHRRIVALVEDLRVFQCVTLKLQLETLALRFPATKVKLSATAPIVLCPTFEAAALKAIKHVEMSAAPAISGSKSKQLNDKGAQEDFATS
ncbi:hypothetical protein L914_01932, partial [Phytophthora nicotianae]